MRRKAALQHHRLEQERHTGKRAVRTAKEKENPLQEETDRERKRGESAHVGNKEQERKASTPSSNLKLF